MAALTYQWQLLGYAESTCRIQLQSEAYYAHPAADLSVNLSDDCLLTTAGLTPYLGKLNRSLSSTYHGHALLHEALLLVCWSSCWHYDI